MPAVIVGGMPDQDELRSLLRRNGIEWDERYVWE
jgi:hypothetical protein